MPKKVKMHVVYDKTSHYRKGNYAPVISHGIINTTNNSIEFTAHLTPELKHTPVERRILLAHEKREAELLRKGYSVTYSHRQSASKDPMWLKGKEGYHNIWNRLGHGTLK